MHIYGPTHLHGPQAISGPHGARPAQSPSSGNVTQASDELNLSQAGRAASEAADMVDAAKSLPDIRQDRVDQIRAQIAAGTYETAEKMDIAVDRLLDEIG
jgi:negative regulator of flagellin synthesis FlgM